jgi:hypothetical protein
MHKKQLNRGCGTSQPFIVPKKAKHGKCHSALNQNYIDSHLLNERARLLHFNLQIANFLKISTPMSQSRPSVPLPISAIR